MGSGGTDASTFFGGYVGSRIKTFNAQISLIDSGMVNFPKLRNVERGGGTWVPLGVLGGMNNEQITI